MFDNKVILITGGTGSFGQSFTRFLFANYKPQKVIIYSRDEMKQWQMQQNYVHNPGIRFFIGDVRDRERLYRAFTNVDFVVHAAATKIVPTAENDPFECVKTNVAGAMNVIDAAIDRRVKKVVALSTDKASSPVNLYGATKLVSDKLFVASNAYSSGSTLFSVVRYGNVMGSRGSVIPFFINAARSGELPVTHKSMTRFMITLNQGINLVVNAFDDMRGGETYVKKIPSMKITELAKALGPDCKIREVGVRPGEKIHEQMIGPEDAAHTYEYDDYYKILPVTITGEEKRKMSAGGVLVPEGFVYSSENNSDWMSRKQLLDFIESDEESFLKI